ncbi:KptA family-domain-containing protein [Podospora australis]|uniref:2'-phosphotransferase n=1 Tax=Podospora australis TaxID=1536484 RepID=A0AAN6WNE2_9PEZI|nr:KptA family-domain-containing protein [Podospora australis]
MVDPAKIEALTDRLESLPSPSSSSSKKKSGGRSGGDRTTTLSRALSRLLRHQATSANIPLDPLGFAPLSLVLAWPPLKSLSPTLEEILTCVHSSDKQRFALKPLAAENSTDPKDWLIRANQGHSIKLSSDSGLLKRISLSPDPEKDEVPIPETVVHGTYFAFWPKIVESGGLKPMGRNHVHCSVGLPEDEDGVISGMRKDAEVLVYIDLEKSLKEGDEIKWWLSENGVVLTEGNAEGVVPTKYFKEVVGRKQDVGVLWKDGEHVADLPEGIKIKAPHGKGGSGGGRGGRGGKRGGQS